MHSLSPKRALRDRVARPIINALRPFYRQYPPESPVDIFLLDIRGAYSPTEHFFYNRVPKSANSTIMKLLGEYSTYCRPFVSHLKDRWLRPSHMSSAQVQDMVSGRVFCFTFVRDPYARVLSAYREKILGGQVQLARHFGRSAAGNPPDFETFCRFLDQGGLHLDAHWAPQADLMLLPLERFDLIGKVETMAEDLSILAGRLGAKQGFHPLRVGKVTASETRLTLDYSDASREVIRRLYRRDFDLFGYDPE